MKIEISMPYLSQWDNRKVPGGTCNLTSLAMCMLKYGIKGPNYGFPRLPDNLYAYCEEKKLDRHLPEDIDRVSTAFGLNDNLSRTSNFAAIKAHLFSKRPVIVHGWFTPSGHIIVLKGVDEEAGKWQAHDPAGKWNQGYWDGASGENVWYDSAWLRKMLGPDGDIWAHLMH